MARRPGDGGAAAVEMAIILPLLLMLAFGIVDFGRAYNAQITLTEAARESVRAATLPPDGVSSGAAAKAMAKAAAEPLELQDGDIVVSSACDGSKNEIAVQITYEFSWLTPLFGTTTDMSGKAEMPCPG